MTCKSEYIKCIILLYFFKTHKNYCYSELQELVGMSTRAFYNLINTLIREGYLVYNDYELVVSERGLTKLINQEFIIKKQIDADMGRDSIKKNRISIFSIYCPVDFKKN